MTFDTYLFFFNIVHFTLNILGYIYHGQEPKDLIQLHTSIVGRMAPVAEWVSNTGIVVGWEGGTKKVLELHAQLMAANISVAGYWLQDWSGLRIDPFGKRLWWNWELDIDWYPQWEEMIATISPARLTTYMVKKFDPHLDDIISRF